MAYTNGMENNSMKKRVKSFKENDQLWKSGYEAMGTINLGFAESGMAGDTQSLQSYEYDLAHNLLEVDDIDD